MSKKLLTQVITQLVNAYSVAEEYGVALVCIPDFDYIEFIQNLALDRRTEMFFLGFTRDKEEDLLARLSKTENKIDYAFTVEAAERSRNSGNEEIFRILIIKRADIEKISSLRWFPEITLETIYTKSCDFVKKELSSTNRVIEALIQALRCKPIRSILSFERVLGYLDILLNTDENELPEAIKSNYYKLGLCADKAIDSHKPSKDDFVKKIRENHRIVERIGNLEQAERQGITNYYTKQDVNKDIPRFIIKYYKTRDIELLKSMDITEVETCLKAAKRTSTGARTSKVRGSRIKPTALAAQLAFENNPSQIQEALTQLKHKIEERPNNKKAEKLDVNINNIKVQLKTEPITEIIAEQMSNENDFGGVIHAEVQSPGEAIRDNEKYPITPFKKEYLNVVWDNLTRISPLITDGEAISQHLNRFLMARERLIPFRKRLQDAPMLQIIAEYRLFVDYLQSYERLLDAINEDFPKLWRLAPSNAKEIINIVMSLDYVFIIGNTKLHAVPTPLNALYLWKYVELAKEILSGKSISNVEEGYLSDEDKAFIIRKSDDIPDPLSVMLLPVTIASRGAAFLPLSGRIGMLPVYSNQPQINQSESGIDILKNQIIRYLCLYPHAGMMLKLVVIDPPSVEAVVSMLKLLNRDKEFNISGIEISIFRTKEVSSDWIEIEDESLNDGMLGKIKGKRSLNFKLRILDKRSSYEKILSLLSQQQHLLVIFDPNEIKIETAQNSKYIHIHPLCVPKIYKYNPIDEKVEIRPANEGGIFTTYASIIEKLNEHPSSFSHTSTFFNTPLRKETYDQLLDKSDWLIILDQSLKSWDASLRAASEKLFYREDSYRSIGIYSNNCRKFILGYSTLIKQLGNLIPNEEGIKNIIGAIRETNDDGLLSIVSHTSNKIFDTNHGKGSLGIAIAALNYKRKYPKSIIVGLDTQLAQEWLSERDDGRLPDLIGIRLIGDDEVIIDIIEVKTHSSNPASFVIRDNRISGGAVEQAKILEALIKEMFGKVERITTVSRREILREQVFDGLFQAELEPREKLDYSEQLNKLFAGQFLLNINKNIFFVDFENNESSCESYRGENEFANDEFILTTIGCDKIRAILTGIQDTTESHDIETSSHNSIIPNPNNNEVSQDLVDATQTTAIPPLSTAIEAVATQDTQALRAADEKCAKLNRVFRDYGIKAYPVEVDKVQEAARFTRFTVELKSGETFKSLERAKTDIGIQLETNGEILINHIKGTKYISVDVPFIESGRVIKLIDRLPLLDNSDGKLDIIAGQTADGAIEIVDIAGAPHMLIAGTTGSGKTIFLQAIIVSLLYQYSAEELELLIIDPKQTDFIFFEDIPHLYGGHVVIDAEEALKRIQEINAKDKEERTAVLRSCRSKDIESYNEKNPNNKMKRLVIIIDEYSDLIQAAEMQGSRKEFEKSLLMLLQRVRNLGIHIIIATQRPSAQIVTGALKAVIPFRVSFRLPSHTDSQTIIDMSGAENLLGKGDMLMVTESDTKRMQGLYISEDELEEFIEKL